MKQFLHRLQARMFDLYDSKEGLIQVYKEKGGYYLRLDKYDEFIKNKSDLLKYLKSVGATFLGQDKD